MKEIFAIISPVFNGFNRSVALFCLMGLISIQAIPQSNNLSDDILRISKNKYSFGIYKSSITKLDSGNVRAWINLQWPSSDKSKPPIEELSELLIEISCKKKEMKFIKAVDSDGIDRLEHEASDGWDIPSPTQDWYLLIIKVCELSASK